MLKQMVTPNTDEKQVINSFYYFVNIFDLSIRNNYQISNLKRKFKN